MDQFDQAKAQEGSDAPHYDRNLAGIFWHVAVHDGLRAAVAKLRASDLRLFCCVTGVQIIDQVGHSHLRPFSGALKGKPEGFAALIHHVRSDCHPASLRATRA